MSTDVGAVRDQVILGQNGWLIKPTEEDLMKAMIHIIEHPEEIEQYHQNLSDYHMNRQDVEQQLFDLFRA